MKFIDIFIRSYYEDVFELSHVARPFVFQHDGLGIVGKRYLRQLVLLGHLHGEESEQEQDVVAPLSQRRHHDGYGVESIVEVFAEASLADSLSHVDIGNIATLTVLGIGLIFAAVFVCLMSIARKRLETDIAAKVDVILGSQLMHHLLALPLRYFQVRRVGDTLTRVSALNSIREFLTGSTITALLDGVFSIIFFGLMAYYSWQLTLLACRMMRLL